MSNCDVGPGVFYDVLCISRSSGNETSVPQLCWLSNLFEGSTVSKAWALQNHHLSCGCHECNLIKVVASWILAFLSPFMVTATNHATMTFRKLQIYTAAEFLQVKKLQIKTWVDTDRKTTAALSYEFQNSSPSGAKVLTRPHQDDVWDQLFSRRPKGRRNRPKNHPMSSVEWQPSPITVQGKKHGRPSAQRTFWKSQTKKIWTGLTLPTCNIQRRSSPVAPGCTLGQSIHPHFKGWQIMSNQ